MKWAVFTRIEGGYSRRWTALFGFLGGAVMSSMAWADPISPQELPAALAEAKPGSSLEIAAGTYQDLELRLVGKGSSEAPIIIRAEKPGEVVFSGRSSLALEGEHLVLDGLFFKDGHAPGKTVVAIEGSHCRLTNTVIDAFNPPDPESKEDKWVSLKGQHHQVDRCLFQNKTSKSVTLTVWRERGKADHHTITLNHFRNRPRGRGANGYETIRIGTSEESESDSLTVVSRNLFEACDGEMEAVSVKAGKCRIEGNTFSECAGTVTLRHGDGSQVSGNLFAGKKKANTGGVRIYGSDHVISNNLFIGLTGRGGGALSTMAGETDPPLSGYQRVENVRVEGNLFAANQGPAMKLDEQFGEDDRVLLPTGLVIRANVFSGDDLDGLVSGGDRLGLNLVWERNQIFANNQIPREITATLAPPLTPLDVGAAWFRELTP